MFAAKLSPEINGRRYVERIVVVTNDNAEFRDNPDWVYVLETTMPVAQVTKLWRDPTRFYLKNKFSGELAEDFSKK